MTKTQASAPPPNESAPAVAAAGAPEQAKEDSAKCAADAPRDAHAAELDGSIDTDEIKIQLSVFPSLSDTQPKPQTMGWGTLCSNLQEPQPLRSSKDTCELIKLARFDGTRKNGNVAEVFGIEADYDAELVTIDEAADKLVALGVEALFYSSASHGVVTFKADGAPRSRGGPRWRVLAPLSAPCAPSERRRYTGLLNAALGGILGSESFVLSQCYYFGRVQGVTYEARRVRGQPLDVALDELAWSPVYPTEVEQERPPREAKAIEVAANDPVAQRLVALGLVKSRRSQDGGLNIVCPFADEHSSESSKSSTTYFPPHTMGYALGGFKCQHAHCAGRSRAEFINKIGLGESFTMTTIDGETGEIVEVVSPDFSDDQLALVFAERGQSFLKTSPGMGWMVSDGLVWSRDVHLARYNLARSICREVAKGAGTPAAAKALASSKAVQAVINLAQSDHRLMVPDAEWDADKFVLNTPAGVVDLRSGAVRQRSGDLVTRMTAVSPDASAACPHWLKFLSSVCGGDTDLVTFLQRVLGYMLTGDRREQKLFFIWGTGSNGKTTLGELLLWLLGGYGLKLSSSVLMQSPHDRHPTELAQLQGVRSAISSELEEGQFFNEARVKELTGDDTLSARFMRGDFFAFQMSHKHLVIGNHKPRLKGGDPALARRMVLIPFKAAFSGNQVDKDMPTKLRAEGAAILAWMVQGAVDWFTHGLTAPEVVVAASREYMAAHNDVELWIEEECNRGPELRSRASDLYEQFNLWKTKRGERAPSQVTWSERMTLIPGVDKIRSNGTHYTGLRIKWHP